jgi:hypothetical protein
MIDFNTIRTTADIIASLRKQEGFDKYKDDWLRTAIIREKDYLNLDVPLIGKQYIWTEEQEKEVIASLVARKTTASP